MTNVLTLGRLLYIFTFNIGPSSEETNTQEHAPKVDYEKTFQGQGWISY